WYEWLVRRRGRRMTAFVILVRFGATLGDNPIDVIQRLGQGAVVAQPQAQHDRSAGWDGRELIMDRRLGADPLRVSALFAVDDLPVKGVLDKRLAAHVAVAIDARSIGFVIGEYHFSVGRAVEDAHAESISYGDLAERLHHGIVGGQANESVPCAARSNRRFRAGRIGPRPGVSKPQMRKEVERGRIRA